MYVKVDEIQRRALPVYESDNRCTAAEFARKCNSHGKFVKAAYGERAQPWWA